MPDVRQKSTLVDKIYSNIRKDITQGVLLPGEKINNKELSQRYGVSLTPIKLALNRLVSENIIEDFPRQGMKIKSVQADEIDEIFDIRLMLDLYYTKEIITTVNYNERLKEELLHNVKEHMEFVTTLDHDPSVDTYMQNYRYDHMFHELFLKCSGNRKVVDMFRFINPFLYTNYIFRRQSREKDIAGVKEHEAILNAILSEDEEALKKTLKTHINNAKTAVRLILKVYKIL